LNQNDCRFRIELFCPESAPEKEHIRTVRIIDIFFERGFFVAVETRVV